MSLQPPSPIPPPPSGQGAGQPVWEQVTAPARGLMEPMAPKDACGLPVSWMLPWVYQSHGGGLPGWKMGPSLPWQTLPS